MNYTIDAIKRFCILDMAYSNLISLSPRNFILHPRFVYIKFVCTYLVHFDQKAKKQKYTLSLTHTHTYIYLSRL